MTPSPRKPLWRRLFGTRAERVAGRFLRRAGFRLVAWNVYSAHGEIDLVALDGRTVVFVEVRSTDRATTDVPAESVDDRKQARLTACALDYLRKHRLTEHAARFDVVLVCHRGVLREPHVEHHRHAFEAVGRYQMYS